MSRIPRLLAALTAASLATTVPSPVLGQSAWIDLVDLYEDWREFERPDFVEGVPDYSASAMARQQDELMAWKERLWAFDTDRWSTEQLIDWHLVRAEMNGLDFDHKIRRPWARDPAFYVMMYRSESDVPAHEGPVMHGWIDTWTYDYPLSASDAEELTGRFRSIPTVLDQAKENLAGSNARDLWQAGIRSFRGQAADLRAYASEVSGASRELDRALTDAARASDDFAVWVESALPGKTGPSGVGPEAYSWYMNNVHLTPYTWSEQVTLMKRELARSHASLRLEENRNRHLPQLERIQTPEEHTRRLNESVDRYMAFLRDQEIETIEPWMDASLRAVNGSFTPAGPDEIRNFFQEVIYRDPDAFRPHMHHWIELARMREEPHASPIRATPSLFNIYDHRSEAWPRGSKRCSCTSASSTTTRREPANSCGSCSLSGRPGLPPG